MSRGDDKNGRGANRKATNRRNQPNNENGGINSNRSFSALQNRATDGIPDDLPHARGDERRFSVLVDSVPYVVKAVPFNFNGKMRFRVSFNGGDEHVFTWDSSVGQLRAIDDDSSTLPDNLEMAISDKLQSMRL